MKVQQERIDKDLLEEYENTNCKREVKNKMQIPTDKEIIEMINEGLDVPTILENLINTLGGE